jgi:hypothetical protein
MNLRIQDLAKDNCLYKHCIKVNDDMQLPQLNHFPLFSFNFVIHVRITIMTLTWLWHYSCTQGCQYFRNFRETPEYNILSTAVRILPKIVSKFGRLYFNPKMSEEKMSNLHSTWSSWAILMILVSIFSSESQLSNYICLIFGKFLWVITNCSKRKQLFTTSWHNKLWVRYLLA